MALNEAVKHLYETDYDFLFKLCSIFVRFKIDSIRPNENGMFDIYIKSLTDNPRPIYEFDDTIISLKKHKRIIKYQSGASWRAFLSRRVDRKTKKLLCKSVELYAESLSEEDLKPEKNMTHELMY